MSFLTRDQQGSIMKIGLFIGNQPRHLSLAEELSSIASSVHVVQECATAFPGRTEDYFRRSDTMQRYFSHVIESERQLFGPIRFLPDNVRHMALRFGDLNFVDPETVKEALDADLVVVFGTSYIKGALANALIEAKALNIHMGIAPYYRGSSCNFWASYDGRFELVGATIHRLSKGLDTGNVLFHVLPAKKQTNMFLYTMSAARSATRALVEAAGNGSLFKMEPVAQDRSLELRYTRGAEFTDALAEEYMNRSNADLENAVIGEAAALAGLIRPVWI